MVTDCLTENYFAVLNEARTIIGSSQSKFLSQANQRGIELRWQLGRLIEESSKRFDWGKSVIENFAKDLAALTQGSKSFSPRNLHYMRQFYCTYKGCPDLFELAKQVRWGTNIVIMTKLSSGAERKFYLELSAQAKCSREVVLALELVIRG